MAHRRRVAGLTIVAVATVAAGSLLTARLATATPVLATVLVGTMPLGIAVDAQTGRAFVVNNGDNSVSVLDTRQGRLLRTSGVGAGPIAVAVAERSGVFAVADAATRASEQTAQFVLLRPLWASPADLRLLAAGSGHRLGTISAPVALAGVVADRRGRLFVAMSDTAAAGAPRLPGLAAGRIGVLAAPGWQLHALACLPQTPLALAVDSRADRLIVADDGGGVSILDATRGRLLRRTVLGPILPGRSIAVDEATSRAFVLSANLSADRGTVGVFDTRRGALLRTLPLASAPASIAVDATLGRAFVTTLGPATSTPVGAGYGPLGRRWALPVSSGPGRLLMLDARSGAVLHATRLGIAPGAVAVDARHQHVLITLVGAMDGAGLPLGPGALSVVDGRSGAVERTVPVGMAPGAIAVDERAQRVLVVNVGGHVQQTDPWRWVPAWLRRRLPFLPPPTSALQAVAPSVTVLDSARL